MICNLMKIICADDGHYPHMKKCLRPHQHLVRPILNSFEFFLVLSETKVLIWRVRILKYMRCS